jgi:hypothetical protein
MNTEDINTALKGVVSKAIEDIDTKFYNEGLKELLSRIVAKYEKVLFGDVGIWVYGDRVEIYNHVSIRKKGYQHQFKGLIVVGYNANVNKLGSIERVQFTKNSYLKVSESNEYELSERVEEVAIGLRGSDGNELNHSKVMEVLGKLSDSYYLVGIRRIDVRMVS